MRLSLLAAALLATAALLAGCERAPVALKFDRAAVDATQHIFPTDQYRGDERLDRFSEAQLAALPLLRLLATTGDQLYGPATAIRIPFTEAPDDPERWIDPSTLPDALRVYRLPSGEALTSTAPARLVELGEIDLNPQTNTVTLRPRVPFLPGLYGVVVLVGRIETRDGEAVTASADYAQIQLHGEASTDAGFAKVAAADGDVFDRRDTLAYFQFTVGDHRAALALLAEAVAGERVVDRAGSDEVIDITPLSPASGREISAGDAQPLASSPAGVSQLYQGAGLGALDTSGIALVVTGSLSTPNFVSDTEFDTLALPTNGTFLGRNKRAPFGPDNPVSLSRAAPFRVIPYLALFPTTAETPPPIVVAIHGVSRSKEDWLTLAPAICRAGFALIAIDLYQHGARQADIAVPEGDFSAKVDPVLAAAGQPFPDPFINPTFLPRTRDKLRQSFVDQLALIRVVAAADGQREDIDLDGDGAPDRYGPISLISHSLGSMLAATVLAVSPDIDRAVLSAPGGSYAQVLTDSPSFHNEIDLLLYATANAEGIGLLSEDKVMLPGLGPRELYDRVAETALSPIDPLTFAPAILDSSLRNGAPRVLVQLIHRDLTVPNSANLRFVHAVAAGASDPQGFPAVSPLLFPTDLWEIDATDRLPSSGVTEFEGGHNLLLDFVDPAVTFAAQTQLIEFLSAP